MASDSLALEKQRENETKEGANARFEHGTSKHPECDENVNKTKHSP